MDLVDSLREKLRQTLLEYVDEATTLKLELEVALKKIKELTTEKDRIQKLMQKNECDKCEALQQTVKAITFNLDHYNEQNGDTNVPDKRLPTSLKNFDNYRSTQNCSPTCVSVDIIGENNFTKSLKKTTKLTPVLETAKLTPKPTPLRPQRLPSVEHVTQRCSVRVAPLSFLISNTKKGTHKLVIEVENVEVLDRRVRAEKCYKCDLCSKIFSRKSYLVTHIRSHTAGKQYKGDLCRKKLDRHDSLNSPESLVIRVQSSAEPVLQGYTNVPAQLPISIKKGQEGTNKLSNDVENSTKDAHEMSTYLAGKPYKCDLCCKTFSRKSYLITHIRNHTARDQYKGDLCRKNFDTNDSHNSPIGIQSRTPSVEPVLQGCSNKSAQLPFLIKKGHEVCLPYECGLCCKTFSRKCNLITHMHRHTAGKQYKNDLCSNRSDTLNSHKSINSEEKPHTCVLCNATFTQKRGLSNHMRSHTNEKPHKYDLCQRRLKKGDNLISVKRINLETKFYNCDFCRKTIKYKSHLIQHIRKHLSAKPYKCDLFSANSNLAVHKHTHLEERIYKCYMCCKSFRYKGNLSTHMRCHTGEKPYKCDLCNKMFRTSSNLAVHKRTHFREDIYKCDMCCKSFSQKVYLIKHMRCHTSGKSYKCDLCNSMFTRSDNLTAHKRSHLREKTYKCDLCCESFSQNYSLIVHKQTHLERVYKCDMCSKSFGQKSYLIKHKRCHSGKKPYKCDLCIKMFSRSDNLTVHKKKNHTNEYFAVNGLAKKTFDYSHLQAH